MDNTRFGFGFGLGVWWLMFALFTLLFASELQLSITSIHTHSTAKDLILLECWVLA